MESERRYFQIKSQHDDHCTECEVAIYKNEPAIWDSIDRKLFCIACGNELQEGEK